MSKLPYFKFNVLEWLSGAIQLLSDAEKGTFIDLCAMIWKENGEILVDDVLHRKLRISDATLCERIRSYTSVKIMERDGDILRVKFIENQISEYEEICKKNTENAKKRWEPMRPDANKKRKEKNKSINTPLPPFEKGEMFFSLIPEKLDTVEFKEIWKSWEIYKIEKKKKLTESTAKAQLKKLSKHTPEIAGAMIQQSIEGGWSGIFEIKEGGGIRVAGSASGDDTQGRW